MSKLKEVDIDYDQVRELVNQLDFGEEMSLIREVTRKREYKKNFYSYTERLAKKYNMPNMCEEALDTFLHEKN